MNTVQYIYLLALVVGLGYVLISGLLGYIGGDTDLGGHDISGHDLGSGHVDTTVDIGAQNGSLHFSPFSPLVIATFIGAFGAVGLIGSGLHLPTIIHAPVAVGGGIAVGFFIAWLMAKLNQMSMAQTDITPPDLVGREAVVSVFIPASGYGEITYEAAGSRYNAPAQSEGKTEIPKDSLVVITRIVGNTFFVKPSAEEKFRKL